MSGRVHGGLWVCKRLGWQLFRSAAGGQEAHVRMSPGPRGGAAVGGDTEAQELGVYGGGEWGREREGVGRGKEGTGGPGVRPGESMGAGCTGVTRRPPQGEPTGLVLGHDVPECLRAGLGILDPQR